MFGSVFGGKVIDNNFKTGLKIGVRTLPSEIYIILLQRHYDNNDTRIFNETIYLGFNIHTIFYRDGYNTN